jgi:hypothetical protein
MTDEKHSTPQPAQPAEALQRLNALLGTWDLRGRTLGAPADDIHGWSTFEWLPGGHFMKVTGEITQGSFHVQSLEIIGNDPANQAFSSQVFSNFSGEVSHYGWNVLGDEVTHWDAGYQYTGHLSADGQQLTGGWRRKANPPVADASDYDAVMTRRQ